MKNFFFMNKSPYRVVSVCVMEILWQCLLLILIFFCQISCSRYQAHPLFTNEEKERYHELFVDMMLYETGIYTLCGDKPVSISLLEDCEEVEDLRYIDRTKEKKYRLIDSWDHWLAKLPELGISKFLFVKKEIEGMPNVYNAFFVNIPATIDVLHRYYDVFVEEVGFHFDPEKIVYEIQDKDSEFWNRAFLLHSHITKGLLHGFEYENATKFADLNPTQMDGQLSNILLPYEEINLYNFNLPFFRYFRKDDPVLAKYKREREKIRKYFKEKSLFDGTIELLRQD